MKLVEYFLFVEILFKQIYVLQWTKIIYLIILEHTAYLWRSKWIEKIEEATDRRYGRWAVCLLLLSWCGPLPSSVVGCRKKLLIRIWEIKKSNWRDYKVAEKDSNFENLNVARWIVTQYRSWFWWLNSIKVAFSSDDFGHFEPWSFLLVIVWHAQADVLQLFLEVTIFGIIVKGAVLKVAVFGPFDAIWNADDFL